MLLAGVRASEASRQQLELEGAKSLALRELLEEAAPFPVMLPLARIKICKRLGAHAGLVLAIEVRNTAWRRMEYAKKATLGADRREIGNRGETMPLSTQCHLQEHHNAFADEEAKVCDVKK